MADISAHRSRLRIVMWFPSHVIILTTMVRMLSATLICASTTKPTLGSSIHDPIIEFEERLGGLIGAFGLLLLLRRRRPEMPMLRRKSDK